MNDFVKIFLNQFLGSRGARVDEMKTHPSSSSLITLCLSMCKGHLLLNSSGETVPGRGMHSRLLIMTLYQNVRSPRWLELLGNSYQGLFQKK